MTRQTMTPDEVIGKLHRACTQLRLAIAVYEKEVEDGETTPERLDEAMRIIAEVKEAISA